MSKSTKLVLVLLTGIIAKQFQKPYENKLSDLEKT